MSDTSTSNEVGNNLYTNYKGDVVNPVFYALGINPERDQEGAGNPNATTSGILEVVPREAGEIRSTDLLAGMVVMPLSPLIPGLESTLSDRAKRSGGVGKGEGGVVTLKEREKHRNSGMELGQ